MTGIHVPLITPFTPHDMVDKDALARLAHDVLDEGAAGLVALGTTAEVATLTDAERIAVVDICSTVARERDVPLLVGVGGNHTARVAEELAGLGRVRGVTGALALVPPFTRPSADGVVEHFRTLAALSPVPLIVYNVPYRTGVTLSAETVLRIAALPGVAGTKHSVGMIDGATISILSRRPPGFAVYGGDDVIISPLLALGADGGVLASAHVHTALFVELAAAWRTGEADRARAIGNLLAPLAAALFAEPNPAVIKGVLHAEGRIAAAAMRMPLLPASQAAVDAALACRPVGTVLP